MAKEDPKNIDYEQGTISTVELHDSVRRENPLLPGGQGSVGVLALALAGLILILGGGHLFSTSGGFDSDIYISENYVPEPRPSLGAADEAGEQVAWIEEWMDDGKKVYNNCIACHQASGLGIPGQFPPLVGSKWVDEGTKRLGAILLHGITGPFEVAGQTYNQQMPAWNSLSDEKIAQVITYIRREFGSLPEGETGVVTTEMIEAAREEFGGQTGPYTEADLLNIPAEADLPGPRVDLQTGEPLGQASETDGGEEGAGESAQ